MSPNNSKNVVIQLLQSEGILTGAYIIIITIIETHFTIPLSFNTDTHYKVIEILWKTCRALHHNNCYTSILSRRL